jgi:hypothetical protein
MANGLRHFVSTTGAKAEKLPTLEETEQIKKEQDSLPPRSWLTNYDDAAPLGLHVQDGFLLADDSNNGWPHIDCKLIQKRAFRPLQLRRVKKTRSLENGETATTSASELVSRAE